MHVDGEILDKKFIPKGDAIFRDGDPGEAAYSYRIRDHGHLQDR